MKQIIDFKVQTFMINHISCLFSLLRKRNTGRRQRSNSFEVPVTTGIDSYSSATDLSLIDSQSARDLREARAIQAQIDAAKEKSGFKKLAKNAFKKAKGYRRKSDDDHSHPENIISGLESDTGSSFHQRLYSDASSSNNER